MLSFSFLSRLCFALVLLQPTLSWAENNLPEHNRPENDVKKATIAQTTARPAAVNEKEVSNTSIIKAVNISILKQRLRKTAAIGFFTKLAIRNDLLDLMDKIKKYRKQAQLGDKLDDIRASFDGLLLKLIALLDDDPDLSRDLYVGRELIWKSLLEEKA